MQTGDKMLPADGLLYFTDNLLVSCDLRLFCQDNSKIAIICIDTNIESDFLCAFCFRYWVNN